MRRQVDPPALWECGNRAPRDSQARGGETTGNRQSVFRVFHGAPFPQGYSPTVAAAFVRQLRGPHFST